MIKIRPMTRIDLAEIRELHEKYYSQFEFPDFLDFLCAFIIEDEDDEIVMAGGVEKIAEEVLVTNQEAGEVKIGRALIEAQRIGILTCARERIRELHAFVDNPAYARHLVKHGFSPRSPALSMRINHG